MIGDMEPQTIINIAGGLTLSIVGWLARELWGAVKDLREDIHRIEVDLPKTYVPRVDLDARMNASKTCSNALMTS